MISSWSTVCLTLVYIFKVSCVEEMTYTETTGITYNESSGIAYNESSGIAYNESSGIAYNEASGKAYHEMRPIWNIGHMVNSIWQVDQFLGLGSNSLEFDIYFNPTTALATHVWHGRPCDCFRKCHYEEKFPKYLEYLQSLTSPESPKYRKELVQLFLDCKVDKLSSGLWKQAGEDLAIKLLDHYWGKSKAGAYLLISVPSIAQVDFVRSFRNTMKSKAGTTYDSKIGYDFSGNENIDEIQSTFRSASIEHNLWIGDGISNCAPRFSWRLDLCLKRRDGEEHHPSINKVYYWTVDYKTTMRRVLRMGVDGIITNYPNRLVSVLNEREFRGRLKLATIADSPWRRVYPFKLPMHFLDEGQKENITEVSDKDEMLYNCEKTTYSESTCPHNI